VTVLAYMACTLIWGTTFFAIRQCIGEGGYPTLLSAGLRFVVASVILWAIIAAGFARPLPSGRRTWVWLLAAGVLNTAGYALVYTAEEHITGGLAAVLFGTFPLASALIAGLTGVEKPRRAAVVGALVSLVGIVVIFWERLQVSTAQVMGICMMLASILCSASYNSILKKHAEKPHPLAINAVFMTVTAVGMLLVALVVEREPMPWPPPVRPTIALLYLAIVGSVLAFGAFFYLMKRVRLTTVASMTLLEPIVALGVDALWESQKIGSYTYLGAAITLAGVGVGLLVGNRKESTASA
jgi:drug/metabolite transporter (DMT)-like permease